MPDTKKKSGAAAGGAAADGPAAVAIPKTKLTDAEAAAKKAWAAVVEESNAEFDLRHELSYNQSSKALDLMALDAHIIKLVRVFKMADALPDEREVLESFIERFTCSEDEFLMEVVDELVGNVLLLIEVTRSKACDERYKRLWKTYEKICISILGHSNAEVREYAVRLLNVMYDRLEWQFLSAHVPVLKCAGDAFEVAAIVHIPEQMTGEPVLALSAPSFDLTNDAENIVTFHRIDEIVDAEMVGEQCKKLVVRFKHFPRPGFYDWRFVLVTPAGDLQPLKLPDGENAQGRYVVQPKGLREEKLHEVVVDMSASKIRSRAESVGPEELRPVVGTFHHVLKMLPQLKEKDISSVYLMGALERDNGVRPDQQIGGEMALPCDRPGASPAAVTCRRTPNRMLGGTPLFQKVTSEARAQGMRVMVQLSANISASRHHRRYKDLVVKCLDEKGELIPHRGSDGRANQWEDQVLLNYRKLETWETLLEDVVSLMKLGVGGLYVQQAQSFLPILALDMEELRRVDLDGEHIYSIYDQFYGTVVHRNEEQGFWSTAAADTYPNPFLVKLARTVWQRDPSFLLLGKTYWGRTSTLIFSGLVPRDIGLADAIAQVKGRKVDKDGKISLLSTPSTAVQPLYLWLLDQCQLPEGSWSLQVRSICQETIPYPAYLFGRTAWTAVDLMYLLPGIPMTFDGEEEGTLYRMDLGNIYSQSMTDEWRKVEREKNLQNQMERERRRSENRRRLALRAIQNQPTVTTFTGSQSHSLTRSGSNSSLIRSQLSASNSNQDLSTMMNSTSLSDWQSSAMSSSQWTPPLQPLHPQSAASLTTVSSTESLRKILEKALQDENVDHAESVGLSTAMPRVQSWSVFGAATSKDLEEPAAQSSEAPDSIPKARSASRVDVLNQNGLLQLENQVKEELGPQFGFDLEKIHMHYHHRYALKMEKEVLRRGLLGVIEARKPNSNEAHDYVFSFVRWIEDSVALPNTPKAKEVCLVASNFATDYAAFVLHVEPLKFLLDVEDEQVGADHLPAFHQQVAPQNGRKMRTASTNSLGAAVTGFWECSDLLHEGLDEDLENDAISSYELLNNQLPVCLRPHASMCLHLKWVTATAEEAESRLMTSALRRISRALKTTEFEPSSRGPAYNPSDEEIMEQLRNNFVFNRFVRALRLAADDKAQAEEAIYLALRPLLKIVEQDNQLNVDLIRKTLFFATRYCQKESDHALSDGDVVAVLEAMTLQGCEPIVGSRSDAMEMDISSFVSVTDDPHSAGKYTSGAGVPPPASPSVSEALSGKVSSIPTSSPEVSKLAKKLLESNKLGKIVFIAPELGRWSTVGGLGVMVDELTRGLAQLGADVMVISPYYERNRKGQTGYLAKDNIHWKRNLHIKVGGVVIEAGIHEGRVNGVQLLFIHHTDIFPHPYPGGNAWYQVRMLSFVAKASLEALCQMSLIPSIIVTNDWFAGLVPNYARTGHFGKPSVFANTKFFHLVHNLDTNYEGRQYPAPHEGDLYNLHHLPVELLVDPYWGRMVINPSRAALLASDTWGTVSNSYKKDLLEGSPLNNLLGRSRHPFATSNGVPIVLRRSTLLLSDQNSHFKAKQLLQRKYFHMHHPDPHIPIFSFVGRVTEQKGVHLILDAAEQLIRENGQRIQIICGGPSSEGDPYGSYCAGRMRWLAGAYPNCFWADPSAFFTDGPLVNLGSDFGLMPSLFEPGGIVQHEFFSAGTPVIAFKTGGLKDSVHEYNPHAGKGNGFTFEAHSPGDLIHAVSRALGIFRSDHYTRLRANAAASVIDVADVAVSWLHEFKRLFRCLNTPVKTVFRFAGAPGITVTPNSIVKLVGAFNNWDLKSSILCPWSEEQKEFQVAIRLHPGTYTYKFIVDGEWVCALEYPMVKDSVGQQNNVVTVSYGERMDE